jgi:protein ImuB
MALWFPRLPTDRLQRREQTQKTLAHDAPPLVLVAKVDNALRLSAVDRKATALGLKIGQPLADARAMLPELKVVTANDPADLKLLTRIADWCDRFTPFVALDGPRHLLLDVTGTSHLFGGEQAMLDRIRNNLQSQGFAVRGAIAATAVAARALARYKDGTVVASGDEEKAMSPFPVASLNLDAVITHALRRAGLKTIGQVASRKRPEMTTRFGAGLMAVLDLAFHHSQKPITPRTPPPNYWQEEKFAEPVATEDVIRATLKSLASALAKNMEQHGEGARRLEAVFFRADGAVRRIAIEMGAPTREPAIIERLFREKLETLADPLDPGFGFDLIRLSAAQVERVISEVVDFDANANAKSEIGFLIDRLATRFGRDRILAFQPHDTHIPEEAWVVVPAQHAQRSKKPWKRIRKTGNAPRRPLRLFARPQPVNFTLEQHFVWRKVHHAVAQNDGPERIAMEWWRHETLLPERDYFRVEDCVGKRYWLYRNDMTSQWFLHGVFA